MADIQTQTETRLRDLGGELVLVIRRRMLAQQKIAEGKNDLASATAMQAQLEEAISKLTEGQLYERPMAGRLPDDPPGEATTAMRPDNAGRFRPQATLLQLNEDEVPLPPWDASVTYGRMPAPS